MKFTKSDNVLHFECESNNDFLNIYDILDTYPSNNQPLKIPRVTPDCYYTNKEYPYVFELKSIFTGCDQLHITYESGDMTIIISCISLFISYEFKDLFMTYVTRSLLDEELELCFKVNEDPTNFTIDKPIFKGGSLQINSIYCYATNGKKVMSYINWFKDKFKRDVQVEGRSIKCYEYNTNKDLIYNIRYNDILGVTNRDHTTDYYRVIRIAEKYSYSTHKYNRGESFYVPIKGYELKELESIIINIKSMFNGTTSSNEYTINLYNGKSITAYSVNSDSKANFRYVIHFLDIDNDYDTAVKLASYYKGKKYRAKWFGGGIVFTGSLLEIRDSINNILKNK